jgi:spermidine synthase
VVDDAKHFIANSTATYDLIAADTPAAFSIQTAALYSQPFFQAIHSRLAPDGVLAANLTSRFEPDDWVARRIVAGLLMTYDDVIVVTSDSVGWSFAYASDHLPFDRIAVENALRERGELRYLIFDTPAVRAIVGDAPPITLDSMDIVLQVSADYIEDRIR